jgi:quaternary ammonium compound-resistance protein SugE
MRAANGLRTTSRPFAPSGTIPLLEESNMKWLILGAAGLLEIGWAVGLKYTQGFTRLWPSLATVSAMAVSLLLLGLATRELPLGMAYAIWVGIGALGTGIMGMVLFGESVSATKLVSLALIVAGITGLKLSA